MSNSDPVEGLRPGMRAVVRQRIEHGVTDALGDLVAIDDDTVSIRTRKGLMVIKRAAVVAAKEVPPRSSRRGAAHLAISMPNLERVMVEGWPPVEREQLGGWLLRAGGGFTGRANSVLPLGDSGIPTPAAVDRCETWYRHRELRPLFSVFGPTGFTFAEHPLAQELLGRGYLELNSAQVLTTATRALPPEIPYAAGARVSLEPKLTTSWWDAWSAWDQRVAPADEADITPAVARSVLSGSPDQLFASLQTGGVVVGVAKVAFAHAWAGVSALYVAPDHRRAGVAGQLIGAMADASRARGIRSMYLQVAMENVPAQDLFGRLGFSTHHEYRYLGAAGLVHRT